DYYCGSYSSGSTWVF
nr:immunoglobulin light chain junction region [Macaca mulatta]MOW68742.1 immunoglobulin light chain junction region [Macaca mulatta]